MSELKKLVDDYIQIGRKYFRTGDIDYLPKYHEKQDEINEVNRKLYRLLKNSYFMIVDSTYSFKQIYQVILLLTGIDLEGENE